MSPLLILINFFFSDLIASYGSPSKRPLSYTCDVRVGQQVALHIQSADLVAAALYDVYRSSSHDPVDSIFVGRGVT